MKRLSIIFTLFAVILLSSFRCTTATWSFSILLQFQDENHNNIEGLDVQFSPDLYYGNYKVQFERENVHYDDHTDFKGYKAFFFVCAIQDIPQNTTYLEWNKIQNILDNYSIKVVDKSGVYKEYTINSLRELIQNSEYRDKKVLDYDDKNGAYSPLTFTIQLEKQDTQQ